MDDYYKEGLAADRLKKVYDLATPRIQRYLDKEIEYALSFIANSDVVLEMGSGYGRVLKYLTNKTHYVCGIDSSLASLQSAKQYLNKSNNVTLYQMNADALGFDNATFNVVVCVQNGISAFHVDPIVLVKEMIRVTKPGGKILISSYSEKFWEDRLAWFRLQSEHGLLGEIDWDKTKDGNIVCKDGFTATTYTEDDFRRLMSNFDNKYTIIEIDESSLFCIVEV
ncbi:MAG: class I SAM-dependent methyltransferase [bacterium]